MSQALDGNHFEMGVLQCDLESFGIGVNSQHNIATCQPALAQTHNENKTPSLNEAASTMFMRDSFI